MNAVEERCPVFEIGDRVKRSDRPDTYEITGTQPVKDCEGNEEVWANLRNLRTGEMATSIKITELEAIA